MLTIIPFASLNLLPRFSTTRSQIL
uniref:Glycosyltransferase n=1 Tax=Rhizophora mucronata TaxID=61149 RepID=A0A2P2QB12_RHIMU